MDKRSLSIGRVKKFKMYQRLKVGIAVFLGATGATPRFPTIQHEDHQQSRGAFTDIAPRGRLCKG